MTLQYLPAIVGAITGSTAGIFAGRVMRRHLNRKPRAVHEPHKHVFDTDSAWAKYGTLIHVECMCQKAGRVYSTDLTAQERVLKLEAM